MGFVKVTKIKVDFGKGAFTNFANAGEDNPLPEVLIERFRIKYYKLLELQLKETFTPEVVCEFTEGPEVLPTIKIEVEMKKLDSISGMDYATGSDEPNMALWKETAIGDVNTVINQVAEDGQFWR